MVVVFGLPGSGKSYFAERLARLIGAVYINSDQVRKSLGLRGNYSLKSKMKVYKKMIQMGEVANKNGDLVVMDATFHLKKFRDMLSDNCSTSSILFIEVSTSESLTKERTELKRESSEADFEVYKKLKQEFQPMQTPHLKLNSTNTNLEELLDKSVEYIKLNKAS